MRHKTLLPLFAHRAVLCHLPLSAQQPPPKKGADLGFTDTPILPGQPWHVHDPRPASSSRRDARNRARRGPLGRRRAVERQKIFPSGINAAGAPITASSWDAQWKVENGYFEVVPGTGDL